MVGMLRASQGFAIHSTMMAPPIASKYGMCTICKAEQALLLSKAVHVKSCAYSLSGSVRQVSQGQLTQMSDHNP